MADAHGGEGAPSAAAALTGDETIQEILAQAIELEKHSILYYIGILDMVPADYGRDKVHRIIREEKDHFVTLKKKLGSLKP
jgi:rubrerythrin